MAEACDRGNLFSSQWPGSRVIEQYHKGTDEGQGRVQQAMSSFLTQTHLGVGFYSAPGYSISTVTFDPLSICCPEQWKSINIFIHRRD